MRKRRDKEMAEMLKKHIKEYTEKGLGYKDIMVLTGIKSRQLIFYYKRLSTIKLDKKVK